MFNNKVIAEKPLNKKEVKELVEVIFKEEAKLVQLVAIYTRYTGVGLSYEPYRRCYIFIQI